jgi:hypothetical protein
VKFKCDHCGKVGGKSASEINRARNVGAKLFCDRRCAGLAKRRHKPKAQKVEEKRIYDVAYRQKNIGRITVRKAEYHKRTYDPVKAAIERKKRAAFHVEYCRRPSYKLWKREYDRRRRDGEYGTFAEAFRLTVELNREIKERATNEQIRIANGTWSKPQHRRRADKAPERTRPRYRDRRDRHTPPHGL